MSTRKRKQALVTRRFKLGYKGFLPVKKKIEADLRAIRLAQKND